MTGMLAISAVMAAMGAQPTTSTAPQTTSAPPAPTRVVCRRDNTIGTRLAPRVCRTVVEERRRNADESLVERDPLNGAGRTGGVSAPMPTGSSPN